MTKILLSFFALMLWHFSVAQKSGTMSNLSSIDVSIGYGKPAGQGGFLVAVEPKFPINSNLQLGVRLEALNGITGFGTVDFGNTFEYVNGIYSLLGTVNYLIQSDKFQPFVGAGVGINYFQLKKASSNSSGITRLHAGGMVRGGIEYNRFIGSLEYNIISASNSYLGIKIGYKIPI